MEQGSVELRELQEQHSCVEIHLTPDSMILSERLVAKFRFRNQHICGALSLENVTQASNVELSHCPSNAELLRACALMEEKAI